ncbi:hypothetical protein F4814DRAFT_440661 [Daldinia grandis]|nr:hypothetical protein F4814DRAFT_440661 [Daldinia grandis]
MPPALSKAWDENDDWTGITSPVERRRRQNRLHQRAYRKRRHLRRITLDDESGSVPQTGDVPVGTTSFELTRREGQNVATIGELPIFYLLRRFRIRQEVLDFLQMAFANWSLNLPRPQDLPLLSRLNSFDALARNAMILSIPVEVLESEDGNSPFTLQGPQPADSASQTSPVRLSPTALQRTVKHHPWLDLFPIPGMRDNILRGIQAGQIDEDQVSHDLICDFLNLETTSAASLVIWGDSWDINGWEFSPDFFSK